MLSVFFPSCVGPVEERAWLVYRVNCLFRFASVLMSGLVDVLCFAPRWVGAESSLMEGLCWGSEFSRERAGAGVVVFTVVGVTKCIWGPGKPCLQHTQTPSSKSTACLLQHSFGGVMQQDAFPQQLKRNPWQVPSIGAETLKVTLSSLVANTNERAAGWCSHSNLCCQGDQRLCFVNWSFSRMPGFFTRY